MLKLNWRDGSTKEAKACSAWPASGRSCGFTWREQIFFTVKMSRYFPQYLFLTLDKISWKDKTAVFSIQPRWEELENLVAGNGSGSTQLSFFISVVSEKDRTERSSNYWKWHGQQNFRVRSETERQQKNFLPACWDWGAATGMDASHLCGEVNENRTSRCLFCSVGWSIICICTHFHVVISSCLLYVNIFRPSILTCQFCRHQFSISSEIRCNGTVREQYLSPIFFWNLQIHQILFCD